MAEKILREHIAHLERKVGELEIQVVQLRAAIERLEHMLREFQLERV